LFSGSCYEYPLRWLFSLLLVTSAEDIECCDSYEAVRQRDNLRPIFMFARLFCLNCLYPVSNRMMIYSQRASDGTMTVSLRFERNCLFLEGRIEPSLVDVNCEGTRAQLATKTLCP
jgi:hypothetical protein